MAVTGPFANVRGEAYQGQNVLGQTPDFATSAGGVNLDPRLLDIARTAAQAFPLRVEAFSGVADRASNTTNHPLGYAIDFRIYDDKGQPLPNSPQDAARLGVPLASAYRTYESFAQTMRDIQTRKYPELDQDFRWGGYWISGVQPFDVMHADINPAMHGATGGGDWDNGLNSDGQRLLKGAGSVGMNDVILGQLADLGYKGPNAVRDYQAAHGLEADNVVGPQTRLMVARAVTPPDKIPDPYGLRSVLDAAKSGDQDALTRAMTESASQVASARAGGTPTSQIMSDFQTFYGMATPTERTAIQTAYASHPDFQSVLPQTTRGMLSGMPTPPQPRLRGPLDALGGARTAQAAEPGVPRLPQATAEGAPQADQAPLATPPAFAGLTPRLRPESDALGTAAGAENFMPQQRPAPEALGTGNNDPRPRISPVNGPFEMNPPDVLGTPAGAEDLLPRLRPQSDMLGTAAGAENFMPRLRPAADTAPPTAPEELPPPDAAQSEAEQYVDAQGNVHYSSHNDRLFPINDRGYQR